LDIRKVTAKVAADSKKNEPVTNRKSKLTTTATSIAATFFSHNNQVTTFLLIGQRHGDTSYRGWKIMQWTTTCTKTVPANDVLNNGQIWHLSSHSFSTGEHRNGCDKNDI